MPNGEPYSYESISRTSLEDYRAELMRTGTTADAICIVGVTPDRELLMVKEFRYPVNDWVLAFPAGLLEPGEDLSIGVERELEEETGYRAETIEHLFTMIPTIAYLDEVIDIYVARGLAFVGQELDEDEEITVRAFAVDEITEMIFSGTIQDGKTVAGVLAYKDKYC